MTESEQIYMKLENLTPEKQNLLKRFNSIMSEANEADNYEVFDDQQDYPISEYLAYGMGNIKAYCLEHEIEEIVELAMAMTARIDYMERVAKCAEEKVNEDGEHYHPGFDEETLGQGYFDHNGLRIRDCDINQEHIEDLEYAMEKIDDYLNEMEINGLFLSDREKASISFYFDYSGVVWQLYNNINKVEDLMPEGGYCNTPSPLEADFKDLDDEFSFDWELCGEVIETYKELPELSTEVDEETWER